jgi:polyhydroxyalkanoate synthesis regulator phasin
MIESLKHTIYAGIGATILTAEKIEANLQELVEKGKISSGEAREAAQKISEESKKEFQDARSSMEKTFEEILGKVRVATSKDIEAINKRLDSIENSLDKLIKSDS